MKKFSIERVVRSFLPKKIKICAIGHSHLGALMQSEAHHPSRRADFTFLNLLDKELLLESGMEDLGKVLPRSKEISQGCDIVALSISGNEHHMMGLVQSERPFDFVPRDGRYRTIHPGYEIIPYDLVRQSLKLIMRVDLFKAFSGVFDVPVIVLEPPPPILDENHLRRHPGVFAEKIERWGVTRPSVRYKLWRICCDVTREWAQEAGFQYMPSPESGMGAEGFLHSKALSNDPTHANAWYGRYLITDLLSLASRVRS